LAEDCEDDDLTLLGLLACDRFDTNYSVSARFTWSLPMLGFFNCLEMTPGECVGEVFIGGVLGSMEW